ncbi:MAG: outer-membrane lipoprotein carrier protein LolA [Acidobacteriia bacterium]|nr:outer-membrane lipoprotein carrier protein LolA [Terriglobia bacterium]
MHKFCTRILIAVLLAGPPVFNSIPAWSASPQRDDAQLEHILSELDKTSRDFRTLEAKIRNTKYTRIVDDTSVESGQLWFRRDPRGNKIKIEFKKPSQRDILIADSRVVIYYPKINKLDNYELGSDSMQNKAELGLLAGVGSSGQTLRNTYTIRYLGEERIDGKKTVKLALSPRDPKAKTLFSTQEVWLDSNDWLPVRQKLVESSGDSLTIDFSDVKRNDRISDKVFRIKNATIK